MQIGDKGNEWAVLYNPSDESADIGNWKVENAGGEWKLS
jgi:hypothetical protein